MIRKIITFVIVVLFSVAVVYGQVTITDSLQEVTVTGRNDNNTKASAPVYSITSNEMLQQGVTDIADALHRLPGITLRDYGGAGGMKTVAVRGFSSQHTGVSYDGIMLSDCQSGQIDLQRYTLDNIQSLKLVIGDEDNIFTTARSASNAATLNILTNTKDKHFKAKLTGGSWCMINPMLSYGTYISKVYIGGNIDFQHADNNYPFTLTNVKLKTRENRTNSMINQGHGEINISYHGQESSLSGKVYYFDSDRELPGVVRYYINENDETLRERNIFAQLQYKSLLSSKFSLMLNGKWNFASSDYHNGKPSGGITSAEYWQREYYSSAALLWSISQCLALDYSIDYFVNNINSSISTTDANRKSLLQTLAGKISYKQLSITGRLVWSNYMGEAHRLSPSLSASLKLMEKEEFYLRASYKNIFRMPTFNELYYYHLGEQDLKPESTNQLNVGVTYAKTLNPLTLRLSADFYYNKVKDKIVSIPINMFVWRNINIGKAIGYGCDATASLDYKLCRQHSLTLNLNYSLQKIENHTNSESPYYGNQIAYTPMHTGSATLGWINPWVNLSFTGEGMSERYTTNEHSEGTCLDSFMEFSASAYHVFPLRGKDKSITLRGSLLNIFDKQYDIVAHYPMPGRSWKVSILLTL